MMTLEQERDQPKGATGGEAAFPAHPTLHATLHPGPDHPRLAHPHLSPKVMKSSTHFARRSRTPVRQLQIDADNILGPHTATVDAPILLGVRQRPGKSPRASPIQGHRSPLGKRSTHGHGHKHGFVSGMKSPSESTSRRGSETGVAQKQKKLACEVVVPPLPPPPDPRSQCRVHPQPSSVDSAESVNLMDLSSDNEQSFGSVDLVRTSPMEGQSMEVDYSGAAPPSRVVVTPLASPVWAANTVSSTYHTTSPTAVVSPSKATTVTDGPSPRRTSPTVLSPVVVSMSIVGGINPVDTLPLLEPLDMSCDGAMNTGDTVPLLGSSVDEDTSTLTPKSKDFRNIVSLGPLHLASKPALTSEPTRVCAFVSPAASVTGLQMNEKSALGSTIVPLSGKSLPLLGLSPASLGSPGTGTGEVVSERPNASSPTQKPNITSPAPLSTPDLRVDMFEADYPGEGWLAGGTHNNMEVGSPPVLPTGFPAITPEDLTPAELHEFDMKYGSPHHARSRSIKSLARPTLLALPLERPRLTSLPVNGGEDEDEDDYYRLRHFSITGRRIVNRGDSFKSRRTRSNTSVASDASRVVTSLEGGANFITSLEGACRSLAPGLPPAITLSCDDVSCIEIDRRDVLITRAMRGSDHCDVDHRLVTAKPSFHVASKGRKQQASRSNFNTKVTGGLSDGNCLQRAARRWAAKQPNNKQTESEFRMSTDGCAWSHPCSLATSAASSAASSQASSASEMVTPYRVVMLGAPGVGKTALVHQFMTSEHINAYDNSLGKVEDIKKCWDLVASCGPQIGYYPNVSKCLLIVKPEHHQQAIQVFNGSEVNNKVAVAQEVGALNWLTTLPIRAKGFSFNKQEFTDVITLSS
ncbi:uncharacterized protein LOC121871657 [Homarus americanus]|uniref:uncharacterized protein LOC121871657 n=1 Tax=Homarus americanus TaxID=6706 RepID=UPI001C43E65D|nr:uncharacterized protein LOC121871657 [Homarus americanus]